MTKIYHESMSGEEDGDLSARSRQRAKELTDRFAENPMEFEADMREGFAGAVGGLSVEQLAEINDPGSADTIRGHE
jgi:broad specificity phosphatase PhoE